MGGFGFYYVIKSINDSGDGESSKNNGKWNSEHTFGCVTLILVIIAFAAIFWLC